MGKMMANWKCKEPPEDIPVVLVFMSLKLKWRMKVNRGYDIIDMCFSRLAGTKTVSGAADNS